MSLLVAAMVTLLLVLCKESAVPVLDQHSLASSPAITGVALARGDHPAAAGQMPTDKRKRELRWRLASRKRAKDSRELALHGNRRKDWRGLA